METPFQIATGPEAGSPPETPQARCGKRVLAVTLAAVLLAPGALLAAPLKDAFTNFVVAGEKTVAALDLQPIGDEGGIRRQPTGHRHSADGAGGGPAGHALAAAARPMPAHESLLKLADLQIDAMGAPKDEESTLVGDNGGDGLMSKPQSQAITDVMSGSSAIGRRSQGGGSDGGFGGGLDGGGGSGGGAAQAAASGLGNSTPGPDTLTDDPSLLGSAPGALSAAPEPAVWISLILGFGLTGGMLRKRRSLV